VITVEDMLERKPNDFVAVFGVYRSVAVSLGRDDQPLVGRVATFLKDGTLIYLEPPWNSKAERRDYEIARYDGKPVVVRGNLHAQCPSPSNESASMNVPCLVDVFAIRDRHAYEQIWEASRR